MRLAGWKLILLSLTLCEMAGAQLATRDSRGVAILAQVLNKAGGSPAVANINDFSATGTIAYYSDEVTEGTVTIKSRGLHQFRIDASVNGGQRTSVVSATAAFQKSEDGSTLTLPSQNTIKVASCTFPLLQVLDATQDTTVEVSYGGIITHNGQEVHDILVQRTFHNDPLKALSTFSKAHIFVDPQMLTVQAVEDTTFAMKGVGHFSHEMQFADYRTVDGVLIPFSITEFISGQKTMSIELGQLRFNTGLSDSVFE